MKNGVCGLIILIFLLCCDLADHLMHMEPPEILSVSPGEDYADPEGLEEISLLFSAEMDRISVERAFRFSEDDSDLDGTFLWRGRRMFFNPYNGISPDRNYGIILKKSAEDRWGNSLEADYYHRFFTGLDHEPPFLTGSVPEDFTLIEESRTSLILFFSEALDRGSFNSALKITPDILIEKEWNSSGDRITLSPLEAYEKGVNYHLTLSDSLKDTAGNPLSQPVELVFRRPAEDEPVLLELALPGEGGILLSDEEGDINRGLEKDLVLEGIFSSPVDYDAGSTLFSLQPSLPFDLIWDEDLMAFSLIFTEYLCFGESYRLQAGEKSYILLIDGEKSRPLRVSGVVFCPHAAASVPLMTPLSLNSSLGAGDSSDAFFDFYLEHASGSSICLSSFMEALSMDSAVMTLDYRSLEFGGEGLTPAPDPRPGENVSLIRLNMDISGTGPGGTVHLEIDRDLRDSQENSLEELWSLTVSQP